MRKLANVSVDLDGLSHYHDIHALGGAPDPSAMFTVALPRLLRLFEVHGVRATFFVIASDLEHRDAVRALRGVLAAGHEVASHTYRHPYNLRDWSISSIADEIERASSMIRDKLGVLPRGFRTPGYNVDTRILRILSEQGYAYDSSVFNCPAYYTAKAAVMGAMWLSGNPSRSAITDPKALLAPIQPYRPSRFGFHKRGDRKHSLKIWEIPIGVVPGVRLPVIGTSVGALSPLGVRALYRGFKQGQPLLQFEMHGIDALDHSDDVISSELAKKQPDVRRSWAKKEAAFGALFAAMSRDYTFATLLEVARELDAVEGHAYV